MNQNLSLLNKANKNNLVIEPYPYIVINDALDEDLYSELESCYPSDEEISGTSSMENNTRYQISAKDKNKLPEIWQDFVDFHSSSEFYKQFIGLFGEHLPTRLSWAKNSQTYTRKLQQPRTPSDISLDCQVGINSPVKYESSVKGAHVDNRVELYAGLFYMKQDGDTSEGGNLEIFKPKEPKMPIIHKQVIERELLEKVDEVIYGRNTFVIFLCSKYSIHGVSPRCVTDYSRRLVNVIAEFSAGRACF
tara:strand:- start:2775 stop:3518 length:744 start_codon:yes stop_codon:yes gene_type:complete